MTATTLSGINDKVDPAAIDLFHREGWTVLHNLISGQALETLQAGVAAAAEDEDLQPKAEGFRADQASAEYRKTLNVVRNIDSKYSELTVFKHALGPVASQLLKNQPVRLWGDRIFAKPPLQEGSQPTLWHQDFPKLPVDRRGFLTIWIAVDDVPLEKGPLTFLPGSHRLGPLGATDQLGESELNVAELFDDWDSRYLKEQTTNALKAGEATVHDGLMLHRANRNETDTARRAWAISYLPADTLYTGSPSGHTDNLGLVPFEPFEHEKFPIVG